MAQMAQCYELKRRSNRLRMAAGDEEGPTINLEAGRAREAAIEPKDWNKLLKPARPDFVRLTRAAPLADLRHPELRQARASQCKNGVPFMPREQAKSDFS